MSGQMNGRETAGADKDDAAAVRIFPPGVPLVAVLAGLGLDWLWPVDASAFLPAPARYWVGGLIAGGSFLGLGLWAVVLFRRSGQRPNPWKSTPGIVDRGPYRLTRNPMYLQLVLVCAGIGVALANVWILLLTLPCAWLLQRFAILPEEAYLEAKFGDAYRDYRRRVRRWL